MYQKGIKRILDAFLALVGLIVLMPVFICICIWIKLDSEGSVFFKQKRVGKDGKYFMIYKFRSMFIKAPHDAPTHLLENPDAYITKAGCFLRKTSLDELPQLYNILKGDMAIIGPRPALYNQLDLITLREQYGVNHLRPGLSGLAQIKGRDELSIEEKVHYDALYVKKCSFVFDTYLVLQTVLKVIQKEGIKEGKDAS